MAGKIVVVGQFEHGHDPADGAHSAAWRDDPGRAVLDGRRRQGSESGGGGGPRGRPGHVPGPCRPRHVRSAGDRGFSRATGSMCSMWSRTSRLRRAWR